jgi:HEAT repeat protein
MGKEVVQASSLGALLEAFYDLDERGKERAIAVFREAGDSLSYPILEISLKNNENDRVRNAAMEVYVALGGRSLPFLISLLNDADEEVRTFSGVMLGTIEDRGAVASLIAALADPDMNVKHAAAEALGKIGDPQAVEPLIDALATDMWLQFPAAIALGDIGDSRAVGPLIALLQMPGVNVPAIQALGKLADPTALGPLSRLLDDEEPSLREWTLKAIAAILTRWPDSGGVLRLSQKSARVMIETLCANSLEARRNAAIALGCCKVREAVSALSELSADRDMGEVARKAIARISR